MKKHYDNILSVSAIVLANLCVSYIMTSQNEEAEELMRKIEKEEEQVAYDDPDKKVRDSEKEEVDINRVEFTTLRCTCACSSVFQGTT